MVDSGYDGHDEDDSDSVDTLERLAADQERFAAAVGLGIHTIERLRLRQSTALDAHALVESYGPLWRDAELAWFAPAWHEDFLESFWLHRQAVVLVRTDLLIEGRDGDLTAVVRRALAEAVEVWGRSDRPNRDAIFEVIEDVYHAVYLVPPVRLWEAGLVPVNAQRHTNVVTLDPTIPWLPDDYHPIADATGNVLRTATDGEQ